MNFTKRTKTCGELNITGKGEYITLNGWVTKIRDLGGLLFIDLRDRYGLTQLKINPENKSIYETAMTLGNEYVISASGTVIERESKNMNIPTGEIEIDVDKLEILNKSDVPPFNIEEEVKASEELRLQYRYMDLRRKTMLKNIILRNEVYHIVHNYFKDLEFVEVETPVLMKSTPEGARDFLVPSRIHKGKFYALPQSPQTYKQILMIAGLDRYVQICKCFRDEDLRADRQPEFTQIDVEMSFIKQDDVFDISEGLFKRIWKEIKNIDIITPFRKLTYDDAILLYGTDKPDLRIEKISEIHLITEIVKDSEFKVFQDAVKKNGIIAAIKLDRIIDNKNKKIEITRKITDNLTEYVKQLGFGGIGYMKIGVNGEVSSPIAKYLSQENITELLGEFNAEEGDTIFILSGEYMKVQTALGNLRNKIAADFNLINESRYEFLWITDFPLFKYNEETGGFEGEHHVFTIPRNEHLKYLDSSNRNEIESIRAICYDLVLNGNEIGSGSIRIHIPEIQNKVFKIIGLTDEEAKSKFGFLLNAFKYGAPPHGGVAFGFDRIVAVLCGVKSIREVIAFPKTVSASSLMDDSPDIVEEKQLKELGIKLEKK
ncbi:MAG: aspartate--tRNA ligase [Ignavibacteria bacterium]|nr:aspartate--tRNA ligase [Ignavibacteria bacterium]